MQPADQKANKNMIRWWSHIKRVAPTAPQSKALVIHPEGRRPGEGHETAGKTMYRDGTIKEMGIPTTDVNNWVKARRPIVYALDADGRRVRLK